MGPTRHATAAALALHKSTDARRMSVTAALTYPGTDRAGDRVRPDGGNYAAHQLDPVVGYEHLSWNKAGTDWVYAGHRNASERPVVIGTARDPISGLYGVTHKAVQIDGKAVTLPFGTTYFDARDKLQSQMFGLIEDDTLPAVSVEIDLRTSVFKALGQSPLEPRPAYDLDRWGLIRWVHCAEPVNEGALTLRKSLTPAWERMLRVAESGKVRGEVAHPVLLKAVRFRFPAVKSNAVAGNYAPTLEKAMPDEMEAAYAPEETPAEPTGGGSTPTVQALYQLAQSLQDMKTQVEEMLEGSEHVKGKKFAAKLLADLDDTAADATDMAAKIEAELGAKEDAEPDAEPEPDTEPDDNEPDDEGVLKCIRRRPAVLKAIRRFTVAEIKKAATVTPEPAPAPAADPDVAFFADLQRTNPKAYRRICRQAEELTAR